MSFTDYHRRAQGEVLQITGRPARNLIDVIYLELYWGLQGIPKFFVLDIQGAFVMPAPPPSGILGPDDHRFQRFQTAIMLEERVRIIYRQKLPPDPAIQDHTINTFGLSTTVEGRASMMDDDWLHISRFVEHGALSPGDPAAKMAIARDSVVDIEFLGPRPVPATEMV